MDFRFNYRSSSAFRLYHLEAGLRGGGYVPRLCCYNAGSDRIRTQEEPTMRVLGISGSPRRGGNTDFVINMALDVMAEEGLETEFVSLADRPIQPCLACGACMKSETIQCLQKDPAFEGMLEKFSAADGILIGSPVYFGSATPQMMALLDRVGYVARRHPQILRRKVGAAIVVARRAGQTSLRAA